MEVPGISTSALTWTSADAVMCSASAKHPFESGPDTSREEVFCGIHRPIRPGAERQALEILRNIAAMRARVDELRLAGRTHALVPTMGALHAGHSALIRRARREASHTTVSVFVNPTQFAPGEDYLRYPRDLDADIRLLEGLGGVDVIFAPDVREFYPGGRDAQRVWVDSPKMSAVLCGRHRPGHFRGVLTIVAKLLAICEPQSAVFGLKDAQQYYMIRRMARDLALPTRIIGVGTVREQDGLAISSRNTFLSEDERAQAPALSRAVMLARQLIESGERSAAAVENAMNRALIRAPLAVKQYAEVVATETLEPVTRLEAGEKVVAAVAVFFGPTRLIDNEIVQVPHEC